MAVEQVITSMTGADMESALVRQNLGKVKTYTQAEIDLLDASTWGDGPLHRDDGVVFISDGASFYNSQYSNNKITAGLFGDSRVASGLAYDTVALRSKYIKAQNIPFYAAALAAKDVDFTYYGGVGGDTVAQALSRIDVAIAAKPDVMFVMLGINSIATAVTQADFDLIAADLTTIYTRFNNAGIHMIVISDLATGTSGTNTTTDKFSAQLSEFNRQFFRGNRGFGEFVDLASSVSDNTGYAITDALYDGLHQSNKGALLAAKKLANSGVLDIFPDLQLIHSARDTLAGTPLGNQILPNPLMQGSRAVTNVNNTGFSATNYTDFTSVVSAVWSMVDGKFGKAQRIVITASGAAGYVTLISDQFPSLLTRDTVQGGVIVRVGQDKDGVLIGNTDIVAGIELQLQIWEDFPTSNTNYYAWAGFSSEHAATIPFHESFEMTSKTPILDNLPATFNDAKFMVKIPVSGTGTATIEIEQMGVWIE